ncbi:ISA1 [Scenedesmus sp. PABB004]|nr:ISA1 [Scenedesmus sp. PABB004]
MDAAAAHAGKAQRWRSAVWRLRRGLATGTVQLGGGAGAAQLDGGGPAADAEAGGGAAQRAPSDARRGAAPGERDRLAPLASLTPLAAGHASLCRGTLASTNFSISPFVADDSLLAGTGSSSLGAGASSGHMAAALYAGMAAHGAAAAGDDRSYSPFASAAPLPPVPAAAHHEAAAGGAPDSHGSPPGGGGLGRPSAPARGAPERPSWGDDLAAWARRCPEVIALALEPALQVPPRYRCSASGTSGAASSSARGSSDDGGDAARAAARRAARAARRAGAGRTACGLAAEPPDDAGALLAEGWDALQRVRGGLVAYMVCAHSALPPEADEAQSLEAMRAVAEKAAALAAAGARAALAQRSPAMRRPARAATLALFTLALVAGVPCRALPDRRVLAAAPGFVDAARAGCDNFTLDRWEPLRPGFHLTVPFGWMNDPHGLFQRNGTTHLFFQYNPRNLSWGAPLWGHAVSADLARWAWLPPALLPDAPGGLDAGGCWSGSATLLDDGTPVLTYTAAGSRVSEVGGYFQRQAAAVPADPGRDPLLKRWRKLARPILSQVPPGGSSFQFRDPTEARGAVWAALTSPASPRPLPRGHYAMAVGAQAFCLGGAGIFTAPAIEGPWRFTGTLFNQLALEPQINGACTSSGGGPAFGGPCDAFGSTCRMWEVVDFAELAPGVHVLKFNDQSRSRGTFAAEWYVLGDGDFDYDALRPPPLSSPAPAQAPAAAAPPRRAGLTPRGDAGGNASAAPGGGAVGGRGGGGVDDGGAFNTIEAALVAGTRSFFRGELGGRKFKPARTDYGSLYASTIFTAADGRQIMFSWIYETAAGCADMCSEQLPPVLSRMRFKGAQALPRALSYDAEARALRAYPVPELAALRGAQVYAAAAAPLPALPALRTLVAPGSAPAPGARGATARQFEVQLRFSLAPRRGAAPQGAAAGARGPPGLRLAPHEFAVGVRLLTGGTTHVDAYLRGALAARPGGGAGAAGLLLTALSVWVDRSAAGGGTNTTAPPEGGPVPLPGGGGGDGGGGGAALPARGLALSLWVDHSVLELFAEGGLARVASRVYPDDDGVAWGLAAWALPPARVPPPPPAPGGDASGRGGGWLRAKLACLWCRLSVGGCDCRCGGGGDPACAAAAAGGDGDGGWEVLVDGSVWELGSAGPMEAATGLRCGSTARLGGVRSQAARLPASGALLSAREGVRPARAGRALAAAPRATVQAPPPAVPRSVAAPRQMPAQSVALEPVVQEATVHYGKPLRGSPTPLGATYNKEAVRAGARRAGAARRRRRQQRRQQPTAQRQRQWPQRRSAGSGASAGDARASAGAGAADRRAADRRPPPPPPPPVAQGAINFALTSHAAVAVKLVLFTEDDLASGKSTHEILLDPVANRTGDVWHIALPGCDPTLLYGYRVSGPNQKSNQPGDAGHKFDDTQVILDPYAKAVLSRRRYGELGPAHLDYASADTLGLAPTWPQAAAFLPRPAEEAFDWEGDTPLDTPMEDLVIYEMHVRGFTAHPSARVQAPGTYLGLIEKLDYLKALGVNAIELLPMFEFNELEYYSPIPGSTTGEHRFNFWGYSTVNFFSPMARYSFAIASGADGSALQQEFKLLVREAHKRGIEVILDVVFNHTAEGNELGPTLSFRGLDNRVYYMLAPLGEYYNYSGCGNTLNCNHPTVRKMIVDCLRHWVTEYHVDGFRFDLASIMTRAHSAWHPSQSAAAPGAAPTALHSGGAVVDEAGLMTDGAGVATGTPMSDPPLVAAISEDPVLRSTKLIAEAWDCDGLYQVGAFPHYGGRWSEWNGGFRDTVRQFLKGTEGPWAGNFASALCGSPNLYANHHPAETDWWANNAGRKWRGNRPPTASINFVCAHDGFTLADLVAYNDKHNDANGEGNKDGESHNLSWNCGAEGPTDKLDVNRLRQRQMRNLACALLLSHGVPMLQMGDEYGHSKAGNNNTYCHDSELNWVDWAQVERDEGGFARFMRRLIHFRHTHPELRRASYVNDNDVQWHGEAAFKPDWSDSARLVAYTVKQHGPAGPTGGGLYIAFNSGHTPKVVELPHWHGRAWQVAIDTGKLTPFDILVPDEELAPEEARQAQLAASMWTASGFYSVLPWSCVVLESVPEHTVASLRVRGKDGSAVVTAAAQAKAGGPLTPTPEQRTAERAAKRSAPAGGLMEEIRASKAAQLLQDYLDFLSDDMLPGVGGALDAGTLAAVAAAQGPAAQRKRSRVKAEPSGGGSGEEDDSDEEDDGEPAGKGKRKSAHAQKAKANREKQRREKITTRFNELAKLVDPGAEPKTDKLGILAEAIRFVQQVQVENCQLRQLNKFLEEKVGHLEKERAQSMYQMYQFSGQMMQGGAPGMQAGGGAMGCGPPMGAMAMPGMVQPGMALPGQLLLPGGDAAAAAAAQQALPALPAAPEQQQQRQQAGDAGAAAAAAAAAQQDAAAAAQLAAGGHAAAPFLQGKSLMGMSPGGGAGAPMPCWQSMMPPQMLDSMQDSLLRPPAA